MPGSDKAGHIVWTVFPIGLILQAIYTYALLHHRGSEAINAFCLGAIFVMHIFSLVAIRRFRDLDKYDSLYKRVGELKDTARHLSDCGLHEEAEKYLSDAQDLLDSIGSELGIEEDQCSEEKSSE